jgi:hypothetical protein
MAQFSFSVLHLGNIADLDPVDGTATAENQAALLGTYRGDGDAASNHITTLTAQDVNGNQLINTNDTSSPEAISFDLGSGIVNTQYDSLFNVDVTVTFLPGSGEPPYNGLGGIIQTETGDLFFVMIDDDAGLGANSFDNVPIDSITVNSISIYGNQQSAAASDDQQFVPCFSAGTLIRTQGGLVAVEGLAVGDQVATLDHGFQTVSWVGSKYLTPSELAKRPNLRAIHIEAGALGDGYPETDLIVSPQHRIMLKSKITQRMTNEPEILVAATKLVGFPGIQRLQSVLGIQYHHFACQSHQLIWANGAVAETLFLGPQAKKSLNPAALKELEEIMPDAFKSDGASHCKLARPAIKRRPFIRNILKRHIKNHTHLVST